MLNSTVLGDRYHLEERLGSGGTAVVYRAHDLTLERTVAIKILRKDYSKDTEFRDRFHQEAKAAANLSHPNIVTIHDFGYSADQLFIVMEFVPGTDIKSLIKERGKFNLPETIDLMSQACAGIGYAHRAGLVHCDMKPQNLLVTPDKRLKVVDFGISRALANIHPDEQSDLVWGSPQYFSPEQAAGLAPSPASDVYSLGVVLYEMMTGRLPFIASTPEELAQQHREMLPPSPRQFNPFIPVSLEQVLLKVLAKEPSSRYRTADQLGRVLKAIDTSINETGLGVNSTGKILAETASSPSERIFSRPAEGREPVQIQQPGVEEDLVIISIPKRSMGSDWLTWFLAFIALVSIGGLIPFWLWVYYILNPPI